MVRTCHRTEIRSRECGIASIASSEKGDGLLRLPKAHVATFVSGNNQAKSIAISNALVKILDGGHGEIHGFPEAFCSACLPHQPKFRRVHLRAKLSLVDAFKASRSLLTFLPHCKLLSPVSQDTSYCLSCWNKYRAPAQFASCNAFLPFTRNNEHWNGAPCILWGFHATELDLCRSKRVR